MASRLTATRSADVLLSRTGPRGAQQAPCRQAKVEYVEKQLSLEGVFITRVGETGENDTTHERRTDHAK